MKTDIYPRPHSTATYGIKGAAVKCDVMGVSVVVLVFSDIVVRLLVVEVEDTVVLVMF